MAVLHAELQGQPDAREVIVSGHGKKCQVYRSRLKAIAQRYVNAVQVRGCSVSDILLPSRRDSS